MSENYRSREERRQVKKKNNQLLKHKSQKVKHHSFASFNYLFITWYCWFSGGGCYLFVMIKDAPKLEKAKLVNPLSSKIYDKTGIWYMNMEKKKGRMLRMSKYLN